MAGETRLRDADRPVAMAHRGFVERRGELAGLPMTERFARIHDINLWGAETSVSGPGSESGATARIGATLGGLLGRLGTESLLDAPCGDAGWMRGVDLSGIDYIGVDVVRVLVERLDRRQDPAGTYLVADIVHDPLPACDVVLCRDCLVHLCFDHAAMAIQNLGRTGARWIIATTFTDIAVNHDCEDGDWRPLNMTLAPFAWPEPAFVIVEGCTEDGGGWRDKALGVWRLDGEAVPTDGVSMSMPQGRAPDAK